MVSEKLGAAFIEVGVDTGGLTTGLAGAKAQVEGFGASVSSAFSDLAASINPATIAIAGATAGITAVGAAFVGSVRAAAQWQTLMVDVQKVTDTTAAGFASLSKDLLAIRGETGASMESIAGAAAGAGRMGIDPTEIADYTETILKMSSAWGMSADAASESIGKIGSVVKPAEMTWTEFSNRMGSTINDLADSMATSEESIVTGMKKVSAQMAMLKPSPDQLSAWAALIGQLQAFGMTAETSGESLKDALNYMMRDDKSGISSMLDMDATEFQEAIREDAIGTIEELAVAISELPIEEQGQALQKFGATGGQMMGMLVGKVDPVTKEVEGLNAALETGASAWENASSLNEAYAKSQETLNAQIDIFRGKISVAATSIGTVLLPYLTQMMEAVNDITQALIDLGTRGWQWLTGGAEGENVAERAAGKVRSWADSQGWLSGYLAAYDAAKARDAGKDIGKDLSAGIDEGTEGVGPAIEENLENVDGEGAGESVGKDFQTGFLAGTAKLGGMFTKQSMDSMHAAGMMYNYATGQYESRSGGGSGRQWGETFEAGGSTIGFAYKEGDQEPWLLTIGDWTQVFGTPDQARAWISAHFLTLDDLISPEQWEIAWKSARQKTTGSYDDPGDVVRLKAQLELDSDLEAEAERLQAEFETAFSEALEKPFAVGGLGATMADLLGDVAEDGWAAFEDGLITASEASNVATKFANLALADPVAFEEAGGQAALDWWRALEGMLEQRSYNLANNLDVSGIDESIRAHIYAGAPYIAEVVAEVDVTNLFGVDISGMLGPKKSLKELLANPEELQEAIKDLEQWRKGTYTPALTDFLNEGYDLYKKGYADKEDLDRNYFGALMKNAVEYSEWYEGWQLGLLGAYARGDVGLQEFFDLWENGGKAIEGAAAAIDEERQNLAGLTAEADCACEAMSSFGMAQEAMSDQLFNRSYIGPTSGYAAFLEEERARGAFHPEAQQLSMVYKVEADTEAAEKSVEDLKNDIDQSEAAPQIDAITQPAYDAVDSFLGWVNGISASVYVGAYGPGTEYMGGGDTGYLESLSPGITSSPGWGTPEWLPQLAEGGIVTGPTIAHLAENNRPEAIIPLDQITKIIGGGGGNTYNISVNGGGNAEEIARAIRGAIEDYDREKNRSGAYA